MVEVSKHVESFFSTTKRLYLHDCNPHGLKLGYVVITYNEELQSIKPHMFLIIKDLARIRVKSNMLYLYYQKTYDT